MDYMRSRLTGLVAAPFTPMEADGTLNLRPIEQQAQLLVKGGVTGAFICGTTGEGLSLTSRERMQVAERWLAVAGDRLKVIVHVGHNNVEEGRALAAHAQKIGACAVAMIGPSFFRPESVTQLVDFCSRV